MSDSTTPPDRPVNAFHQAGHLVIAHLVGFYDLNIEMGECAMKGQAQRWNTTVSVRAYVKVKGVDAYRESTADERDAEAEEKMRKDAQLIAAGGVFAETKAAGKSLEDYYLGSAAGPDWLRLQPHATGYPRKLAYHARAALAERIRYRAARLLTTPRNWKRVERVAAALDVHGMLTGQQVVELLGQTLPTSPLVDEKLKVIWGDLIDFDGIL